MFRHIKKKHYSLIPDNIGPDTKNNIFSDKKIDKNVYAKINVWKLDLVTKIKTNNPILKVSTFYEGYRSVIMFF
jgi:hypothetical protein